MDRRSFLASLLALPAAFGATAFSGGRPAFSSLDLRSYWGVGGLPVGNHIEWAVCDDVEDEIRGLPDLSGVADMRRVSQPQGARK